MPHTNLQLNSKYYCYVYVLLVLFFLGLGVYYSFGVYVLANDYNSFTVARSLCDTKIWYYVLISMIMNLDKLCFRRYFYIKDNVRFYISVTLIEIMLVVFGGIELFRNDECLKNNYNDFFDTNLWRFAIGNFIFQLFLSVILTVKLLDYYCNKNNDVEDYIEDDYYNINENDNNQNNIQNNEIDRIINHAYLQDSIKSISIV